MSLSRSALERWCTLLSVLCFGVIALSIVGPEPARALRSWQSTTIYPWWSLALAVCSLGVAAASALRPPTSVMVAVTAAANGVCAAELAGLGLVARKHWKPAFGMGGGYSGGLSSLQWLALVVFGAGLLAVAAGLTRLVLAGALPSPATVRIRREVVAVGAVLLVLLPIGIGVGGSHHLDATSLVAFALIYSAPWGVSIALTGWLSPAAARAVVAACGACVVLALVGPQMVGLAYPQPYPAFALALVAVLAALWLRFRERTEQRLLLRG